MQRGNLWCISIDSLFCNSVEDQALLDAENSAGQFGKTGLFYTHSITKDNSLHLFFHRWRRLCYFYAMTCDKTKAQILEVKITVELDLDISMDLKSLQVDHYRLHSSTSAITAQCRGVWEEGAQGLLRTIRQSSPQPPVSHLPFLLHPLMFTFRSNACLSPKLPPPSVTRPTARTTTHHLHHHHHHRIC